MTSHFAMDQVYYFMQDDIGDLFSSIIFAHGCQEMMWDEGERVKESEKKCGILISRLSLKDGWNESVRKSCGDKLENFFTGN